MARGGVNKVILIGNLGQDPEVRYMPNGTAVANVRLATSESWRDKDSGEQRELTEWHRVVFYGRLAEISGEYLRKGAKVYVEGRLRTRKWQDQNGQERYTTEIQGDTLQMLDSRSGATRNTTDSRSKADSHPHEQLLTPHSAAHPNQKPSQKPSAEASGGGHDAFVDFDDSIPF